MNYDQQNLKRIPFSTEEEAEISGLARWLTLSAGLLIAASVFSLLPSVISIIKLATGDISENPVAGITMSAVGLNLGASLISLAIVLVMAMWLFQSSRSFSAVVETDDADQEHLTDGLIKLRNYFYMKVAMVGIALLFGCVGALLVTSLNAATG